MKFSKNVPNPNKNKNKNKNSDIIVVGGANWDYFIRSSGLPRPGETIQGKSFYESAGGKGANQAIAASRLGAKVTLIAKIGKDLRGKKILETLTKEGIDTAQIITDVKTHTGVALISVSESGEKQIIVAPGANSNLIPTEIQKNHNIIGSAKVLLIQLEVPLETVKTAVQIAHWFKVFVILDPAPAQPLSKDFLKGIDVIKPNLLEAESLTGIPIGDRNDAKKAARKLLSLGVKNAIVQAPERGDLLLTEAGKELWLPHFPVNSIDKTGSGDAFLGAFATLIARGESLENAAIWGSAAAALKSMVPGAQAGLPKREDLIKFLQERKIHSPLNMVKIENEIHGTKQSR